MECEHCGKPHNGNFGSGRFCSRSCANSRIQTQEANKSRSEKLNRKIKKNCKQCGKEYYIKQYQESISKYCSSKCKSDSTKKDKTWINNKKLYRHYCKFEFDPFDFPEEFNLLIIEERGWYIPTNCNSKKANLTGVSRDHLFSVSDGFLYRVSPSIMKHPANCEIVLHSINDSKQGNSSITLEELKRRILNWDVKYKENTPS